MGELTPILIDAPGRSGTTLFMQLLGTSPAIAFDRKPPFESRYLSYFIRWAELLRRPGGMTETWGNWALDWEMDAPIGPFPWADDTLRRVPAGEEDLALRALRAIWKEFSPIAARNSNPDAPDAVRYYAEKSVAWMADLILDLGPCKVVMLVRDPRDIWLSAQAFDRKRGFSGFGRDKFDSEDAWFANYAAGARSHLERAASRRASETIELVRYEDLVTDLTGEAARIGEWLGLDLDPGRVMAARESMRDHMTSGSPESSIGRWRQEMDGSTQARFERELGPQLRALGYA
ncbi:MAG: sulfotransferase [Planctomycetes bacterium]|nr:sulfotransferase [Planctomycetota bacterium]